MTRTFGIECELAGGTNDVLEILGIDGMCSYHCRCERCRHDRQSPDWTAQEDCTADGEIISRILTYGTGAANAAIEDLARALRDGRAVNSTSQGVHVHVSKEDMTPESWVRFWRLWFRYEQDIAAMAAGKFGNVRSYNSRVEPRQVIGDPGGGRWGRFWASPESEVASTLGRPYSRASWVNDSPPRTVEFRLWNATRVGWRLHLAVGVSVALIECAVRGEQGSPTRNDERPLIDFIGPHLTDESYAALLRHTMFTEGVAA